MAIEVMQDIHEVDPSVNQSEGISVNAIDFSTLRAEVAKLEGVRAQDLARNFFLKNPDMQDETIRLFAPTSEFQASFDPTYKGTLAQQEQTDLLAKRLQESESWVGQRGRSLFKDQREVNRRRKALEWAQVSIGTRFGRVNVAGNAIMDEIPYEPDDVARKEPSKLVTATRNLTLAAGIALSPVTQIDSSDNQQRPAIVDTQSQGDEDYSQLPEPVTDTHAPEIDLLHQIATNFNEATLIENSNGELIQKVDFQGTTINVKLTQNDIEEIKRIKQRIHDTQDAATSEQSVIYIVVVGKGMTEKDRPVQTSIPPSKEPSATATTRPPTIPPATDTPVTPVIPTVVPPTEVPTKEPTEQVPLKENLPKGARVGILNGPNLGLARVFRNGEGIAKLLGLDLSRIGSPVKYGPYIMGTADRMPGDDPDSASIESSHAETVFADQESFSSAQLAQIPDIEDSDERLTFVDNAWNEDGQEIVYLGTDVNDGSTIMGSPMYIDLSSQSLDLDIKAYAKGQAGRSSYITFGYGRVDGEPTNRVALEFVADPVPGKRTVNIRSVQIPATLQNASENSAESLAAQRDWGSIIYTSEYADGVQFRLSGSSITIGNESYDLPFALSGTKLSQRMWGDGKGRQASTELHIQKIARKVNKPLLREFREQILENQAPQISELGEKADLLILAPARADMFTAQPDVLALLQGIGQVLDTNDPDRRVSDEVESYLENQNARSALILSGNATAEDLVTKINNNPGKIFQYGATGSDGGPLGEIFDAKGILLDKVKLRKVIAAARANGSEIIIKSRTALDIKAGSRQPSPMNNVINSLNEISIYEPDPPIYITFEGSEYAYEGLNLAQSEQVSLAREALKKVEAAGYKTGLTNIVGKGVNWPDAMSEALLDPSDRYKRVAGFGFTSFRDQGAVGVLTGKPNDFGSDPLDKDRVWRLTETAAAIRTNLEEYILSKHEGASR